MSRLYYPAVIVILLFSAVAAGAADQTVVLKAARMFDGKSKSLIPNGVVLVQGDKIVDVGSTVTIPSDAKVIDLGDMTLSPGFMDAHTHLTLDFTGNFNERRLKELQTNVSEMTLMAISYARALGKVQVGNWLLIQDVRAFGGGIQQAQNGEQGGFTAARRTRDAHELAAPDLEADFGQGMGLDFVGQKYFFDSLELDQCFRIGNHREF